MNDEIRQYAARASRQVLHALMTGDDTQVSIGTKVNVCTALYMTCEPDPRLVPGTAEAIRVCDDLCGAAEAALRCNKEVASRLLNRWFVEATAYLQRLAQEYRNPGDPSWN